MESHAGLQALAQNFLRAQGTLVAEVADRGGGFYNDVEAVYRLPELREPIRERFDGTLALDTHYQAIAWTMICDQLRVRDSYARTYPPGDILRLVRQW